MPDETTSPPAQHPENHDTLLLRMLYDEQARLRNEIESLREKQQSGAEGKEGKEDKGGGEEKGGGEDKKKGGGDEGKGDDKKDDDKEKKKPKEPLAKRTRTAAVLGARPIFQRTIQRLTIAMHAHAGPRRSALRAFRLADSGLNHQAQLYAYVDDFRYLALLCLFCIPLAFFFKRPDPGAQGGG